MNCYVFNVTPTSAIYKTLITFCCSVGTKMLLVVRDPEKDPGEPIRKTLRMLDPFLLETMRARQWPGTILLADEATLYWYRVSENLCSQVSQMKQGLFEWIHPDAPEDLCFCRDNCEPILVTTSHEHDAYLLLTEVEISLLQSDYPMLWEILEKEGD